jgi:uncharacterized repeat protein (TIGR01451 family)
MCLAPLALSGATRATDADAAWKKAGADNGLRRAFERATYALKDSGHGSWLGANAAQRLTLEFNGSEARLRHPDGSVNFHLTGYGYGDRLRQPAPAMLTGTGSRVEYERGDLTEWYVNGSQGLEQGFTLAQRPGTEWDREPLVIALGVGGGLRPVQAKDDGSVLFASGKGVVLRYAGLKAVDARGRILPSRLEVRASEIRLIVEDRDAQYPLVVDPSVVDPLWTQQQELTASDGASLDQFGYSVSVSGGTAVIGAYAKNGGQGAVYVFVRVGGSWSQQQELTVSDPPGGFGISVSVSGDTAVIGASAEAGQGAAYVFVRSGAVWSQQQKLTASDGVANDVFGISVSVSGNTAVIGDSQKTINSNSGQGAAYVFVRSGGAWSQQQELTASDGARNDLFSYSVSVAGNTAVIGAPGSGAAYVFVGSGGAWSQQQELTVGGGLFGQAVSVSGDTAVIGAPSASTGGVAYLFQRSGGVWSQPQELTASDAAMNNQFGGSVSVSGDAAVIGAWGRNSNQGAAYVFGRSDGVWTQQQELTASDGVANSGNVAGDEFGRSMSTSGDTVVFGAAYKTVNSQSLQGAAYAFVRPRLGTNSLLVGSGEGTSSVALSYAAAWTATANDSFLHVSSGSDSGTGSAVVVFTYDAFTGTGSRTGTLTIAGQTVTVTQAGANYIGPIGPNPLIALVASGLGGPHGVAVDGFGNVYIADTFGYAIKEWSASTQQVSTLVSLGLYGPTSIAVDGSGNVYFPDANNQAIEEWSASTQQVSSLLTNVPDAATGIAVDVFGNVYFAGSSTNNDVEEWSASTQQVSTLVPYNLYSPAGVAVDVSGNVYVTGGGNYGIKEWSPSTQQVTPLLNSTASDGIAVDGSGNLYFTDLYNRAVEEWSASTQQLSTLVFAGLGEPWGVAVDGSGNVYVVDELIDAIYEIPYAFVGPANLTEPPSAGTDSLLPVLPSMASLAGVFAPTSDQSWLSIGTVANGVIGFSFTANPTTSRVANIAVLGQQITVMQNGAQNGTASQTINFGVLPSRVVGAPNFTISATATSGLPIRFASITSAVCLVSGATVSVVIAGTCTIQATQPGNAMYAGATPVNQSFQVITVSPNPPVLSIVKSHTGNFAKGQNGAAYTVTVSNGGAGPTGGNVVVTENMPTGLTLVSMSGTGWSCVGGTCARDDALSAGSSYPSIAVTVNVAANAPASVTNFVTVSGGGDPNSHYSSDVTTITPPGTMSLDQTNVWFGATNNGAIVTAPQTVSVIAPAGVSWSASSSLSYVVVSPSSGVGSGTFTISIQSTTLASPASINGTITVTAGVANSPQYVHMYLNVMNAGTTAAPFGSFDTPANNATGLVASIAVTGWALDDIEVQKVQIWRDPVTGETPTSNGLIYIGDATFVPGARPDVQALYPNCPLNNRAGWGYLMLTNGLPNNGVPTGTGNGTYTLHAIATDLDGHTVELGAKVITCDNAAASTPFGTIDTPGQGATVSGTIVNFGWALTPQPNSIPIDGSTIWVTVDNQYLGHPVYNNYRSDIANGFPGYTNANGAVGYYYLDTTTLSNGIHTMGWLVTDNAGHASGIGSRFFWVLN